MIDSHIHLDHNRYNKDRDKLINNFEKDGIDLVFNIGADLETSKKSVELANQYDKIYAVVGVHPHDAKTYNDQVEEEIKQMALNERKVVAIGEIGLDFYYDNSPRDIQKDVFIRQIDLAHEINMPIVIHSRSASQDTFDILKAKKEEYPDLEVLIHCYSDSVEFMKEYIRMGFSIALGGAVTFANSKKQREVAKVVPMERLLLETDGPYMTPEPYRGKRNEPKYIKNIAEYIGELKNMTPEAVIFQADQNALNFFGVNR